MGKVLRMRTRSAEQTAIDERAADDLSYIRSTMQQAGSFTAVPGVGGVLIGGTAVFASFAAHFSRSQKAWLAIWCVEALLALAIALWFSYRKSLRIGTALLSKPFRRFVLAITPSVAAGAVLTFVLRENHADFLLPALWLLLYGAGVCAGGAHSVRIVPIMGMSFMALGTAAALLPVIPPDAFMALGFGGFHILFGFLIARNYGG